MSDQVNMLGLNNATDGDQHQPGSWFLTQGSNAMMVQDIQDSFAGPGPDEASTVDDYKNWTNPLMANYGAQFMFGAQFQAPMESGGHFGDLDLDNVWNEDALMSNEQMDQQLAHGEGESLLPFHQSSIDAHDGEDQDGDGDYEPEEHEADADDHAMEYTNAGTSNGRNGRNGGRQGGQTNTTSSAPTTNQDGSTRKIRAPRGRLQTPGEPFYLMMICSLVAACGDAGVKIPFDVAAKMIDAHYSRGAFQQAILKCAIRLREMDIKPPRMKMHWPKKIHKRSTGVRKPLSMRVTLTFKEAKSKQRLRNLENQDPSATDPMPDPVDQELEAQPQFDDQNPSATLQGDARLREVSAASSIRKRTHDDAATTADELAEPSSTLPPAPAPPKPKRVRKKAPATPKKTGQTEGEENPSIPAAPKRVRAKRQPKPKNTDAAPSPSRVKAPRAPRARSGRANNAPAQSSQLTIDSQRAQELVQQESLPSLLPASHQPPGQSFGSGSQPLPQDSDFGLGAQPFPLDSNSDLDSQPLPQVPSFGNGSQFFDPTFSSCRASGDIHPSPSSASLPTFGTNTDFPSGGTNFGFGSSFSSSFMGSNNGDVPSSHTSLGFGNSPKSPFMKSGSSTTVPSSGKNFSFGNPLPSPFTDSVNSGIFSSSASSLNLGNPLSSPYMDSGYHSAFMSSPVGNGEFTGQNFGHDSFPHDVNEQYRTRMAHAVEQQASSTQMMPTTQVLPMDQGDFAQNLKVSGNFGDIFNEDMNDYINLDM